MAMSMDASWGYYLPIEPVNDLFPKPKLYGGRAERIILDYITNKTR